MYNFKLEDNIFNIFETLELIIFYNTVKETWWCHFTIFNGSFSRIIFKFSREHQFLSNLYETPSGARIKNDKYRFPWLYIF